jgi:hypothetical protein
MAALLPFLTALLMAAAAATGPISRPAPPPRASGPTLATEDTMHTEVPPVLVTAPRVTLDEILDRVARGERRRDSLMTDQSYLLTERLVRNADRKRPTELLTETVSRVHKKKPDLVRTQVLREYEAHAEKKKGAKVEIRSSERAGMDEQVVNFAFRSPAPVQVPHPGTRPGGQPPHLPDRLRAALAARPLEATGRGVDRHQ